MLNNITALYDNKYFNVSHCHFLYRYLYNLFPQTFLLKDKVKTQDRRAYVTNSHQKATVKKKLILFWHARSRRYRIPRRQSQNPASAPQLSHASPENLDPRNSQWPLLERVPCGHWKGQQQSREQKKAYACGRSRARITCGTQKSGKTTEGRNAQFWQLRSIVWTSYSNRSRVFSARTAFRKNIFRAKSKKG